MPSDEEQGGSPARPALIPFGKTKPTRDLGTPYGCITAPTLRALAEALENLEIFHTALRGRPADRPCLRRVESVNGQIEAHVSSGPVVGGDWFIFALGPNGWVLLDEEDKNV